MPRIYVYDILMIFPIYKPLDCWFSLPHLSHVTWPSPLNVGYSSRRPITKFSSGWNRWSWPMEFASKSRALQLSEPRLMLNKVASEKMRQKPGESGNVVRFLWPCQEGLTSGYILIGQWLRNQQHGDIFWTIMHACQPFDVDVSEHRIKLRLVFQKITTIFVSDIFGNDGVIPGISRDSIRLGMVSCF